MVFDRKPLARQNRQRDQKLLEFTFKSTNPNVPAPERRWGLGNCRRGQAQPPPRRKGGRGRRRKEEVEAEVEVEVEVEAAREILSPPTPELERESTVCGGVDDPTEEEIINKPPEGRHDVGGSVTLNYNNDVFGEDDMSLDLDELLTNVEMEWDDDYAIGTCESNNAHASVARAVSDAGAAELDVGGDCSSISSSFSLNSPWNWKASPAASNGTPEKILPLPSPNLTP